MFEIKGKVLLVIHEVYQDDNDFPLGPAYLTSVLKKEGFDVKVYCQDVFHYPNNHLANLLQKTHFDLIGLGFLAARFKETIEPLCKVINKNKKRALLVLGGHGPSPIAEYMLRKTKADVVVVGEGEETIVDLINCKVNKGSLADINGIAYREEKEIYINKRRRPINDLDSIPFPASEPLSHYGANDPKIFVFLFVNMDSQFL